MKDLNELAERLTDYALFYMEVEAKKNAPKETGQMAQQIYTLKNGPLEGEIVSPAGQSGLVEFGTQRMVAAHGQHDPENPVTDWEALRKRGGSGSGQMMPFMRPAAYKFIAHAESMSGADWEGILSK